MQAEHNILFESGRSDEGRKLLDPGLSSLGKEQAAALGEDPLIKEALEQPSPLLVVSPLRC
jgi:broad specificity phosphatase PhoE